MPELQVGDAEHERREQERDDQHEQQPDEELTERLGEVSNHRVEPRRSAGGKVCDDADAGA